MRLITSPDNPTLKRIRTLQQKKRLRAQEGVFVVEGEREIRHLWKSKWQLRELIVCPSLLEEGSVYHDLPERLCPQAHVSPACFDKIAYRGQSGGLIAVAEQRTQSLADLVAEGFFLIVEGVEKPGNFGAILRTADAAGVTAVINCDPALDIFNPNVVRASLGALFTVPVITSDLDQVYQWCQRGGIITYSTSPEAKDFYHHADYRGNIAIVLGSEKDGLSKNWLTGQTVAIPMCGQMDSLNLSASTAVMVYEALRQRS